MERNANYKWHSSLSVEHGWFKYPLIWDPKSRLRNDNIQVFPPLLLPGDSFQRLNQPDISSSSTISFLVRKELETLWQVLGWPDTAVQTRFINASIPSNLYGCKNGITALGINSSGFQFNRNLRMVSVQLKHLKLLKKFKCILAWLGQRKYIQQPAAEIGAEIVRATAESEILHKITKAFSAGLANLLLPSISCINTWLGVYCYKLYA